ncbi:hypothetical protein [Nocardioides sp. CFH 31398]|uniref:hypothetical protein n=1 Tax=Nocardioides sp. CFH 31398 TaxID=2919579 RepID=UPI001F06C0F3|nr:hypothetical protein [Nocardioides sp. CFH 31398]MCH1867062.1 hypothetical protein [Nocardioides sp. CFH 31398]
MKKFVAMRGQAPDQGEPVHGGWGFGVVCSLHVGEERAVTTFVVEEDVCWLLAYNDYHRIGDRKDAYNYFIDLYASGDLMPSDKDYETFFENSDVDEEDIDAVMSLELLDEVAVISRELLDEARSAPGTEAVRTFRVNGKQLMCVDVVLEPTARAEEGWLSLVLPEDEYLSDDDLYELVASLLPPGVTPLYSNDFRGRARVAGEIVYQWDYYE